MDLQYYKLFNKETSQGIVGLLRPFKDSSSSKRSSKAKKSHFKIFSIDNHNMSQSATDYFFVVDEPSYKMYNFSQSRSVPDTIEEEYKMYVFKISKDVNTLLDHEFKISKSLEELSPFLPHFNRILEIKRNIKCLLPENKKQRGSGDFNPFIKYNCIRDVSVIEYIPSKMTLLKYLQKTSFTSCSEALIHQLIIALFVAQQEVNFTHYDLHLENVLLRRCLKRTFFWYKFMYEGALIERLIFTNGYFPVIFDYGFAYTKGLENTNYNNSTFFTNKGYTPFMFDEINDFKTLMVRMAFVKNCPKKFKDLAESTFLNSDSIKFKLDRETGWIKSANSSAGRVVCNRLKKTILDINNDYKENFIFMELDNVVELFGILIKLPIEKEHKNHSTKKTIKYSVSTFIHEWNKIDAWFSEDFADDKLNIIKRMFEAINNLIEAEEVEIVRNFKLKLFEAFDGFGEFVNVQGVDYGALLSSIIEISNFIEDIVYTEIQRYKKLFNLTSCMDGWNLFNSIEEKVKSDLPYIFQPSDNVVLFDCVERTTSSFELVDQDIIEALNIAGSLEAQIGLFNSLSWEKFN